VLEILLQALAQGVGDLVEADELLNPQHLRVVAGCARVQALDDGGDVAEDAGIHQSCNERARLSRTRAGVCPTTLDLEKADFQNPYLPWT